jgi:uncharacterized protein YkwD
MGITVMRFPLRIAAIAVVFLVFLVSSPILAAEAGKSKRSDSAVSSSPAKSDARARKIHDRINGFRTSQGLKPLRFDPFLSKIAAEHSRNMAGGKVDVGHEGFEKRAKTIEAKVKFRSIAENVGASMGHADPEKEVVQGWLNSPGHLKNIKGDFELTGIGVARKENQTYYFTQIFLKRLP